MKGIQPVESTPSVEIEFDIVREVWSSYELEDGTVLRARSVLMKVLGPKKMPPKGSEVQLGFAFQQLVTVTAPSELRGTPNPAPLPFPELQKRASEEVEVASEREAWNVYRLKHMLQPKALKTKVVVTSVLRIPKEFDQEGNPQYIVNSTTLVTPANLKEIQGP